MNVQSAIHDREEANVEVQTVVSSDFDE